MSGEVVIGLFCSSSAGELLDLLRKKSLFSSLVVIYCYEVCLFLIREVLDSLDCMLTAPAAPTFLLFILGELKLLPLPPLDDKVDEACLLELTPRLFLLDYPALFFFKLFEPVLIWFHSFICSDFLFEPNTIIWLTRFSI